MSHWERAQGASVEWYTPKYVFDALGCTFDLDVAHPPQRTHVPCTRWITQGGLDATWDGFVWLNPPYAGRGSLAPWLERFISHIDGIALLPDRTSADWFQKYWRGQHIHLAMFTPKISFLRPDGSKGAQPSNGSTLWARGEKGCAALWRAYNHGLGIIARPL